MKKSRSSEGQIVAILKKLDRGTSATEHRQYRSRQSSAEIWRVD